MSKVRIIVQEVDGTAAAHVGGPVYTEFRTFDVKAPGLVAYMNAPKPQFAHRSIIGVEVLIDQENADV